MAKLGFVFIACTFFFGLGSGLDCYFCHDNSDQGNCEGITWSVLNCRESCATYQAKMLHRQRGVYEEFSYNISIYRRGCGSPNGCTGIKKCIRNQYNEVYEIDCQECKRNLCNNRANHPGYKFN